RGRHTRSKRDWIQTCALPICRFMATSALVATVTVGLSALLALLAATAVARFRFRSRTAILIMILVAQMVPLEALVIPLFLQARKDRKSGVEGRVARTGRRRTQ